MFFWLMQNAVIASLLAAVVAVVCRAVRPRPAIGHALWLVVLVKLVMPPLPLFSTAWLDRWMPNAIFALSSRPAEAADETHSVTRRRQGTGSNAAKPVYVSVLRPSDESATVALLDTDSLIGERLHRDAAATSDVQLAAADQSDQSATASSIASSNAVPTASSVLTEPFVSNANEEPAPARIPEIGMLLAVWAFGTFVVLVRHGVHIARLRTIVRKSAAAPEWLVRSVAIQSLRFRLKPPRARACTGLRCPMVIGLPRATLLWPADFETHLGLEASHAVIAHELAHLKRCDQLTAWLEVVVTCLWWWNPVVWFARREMREYAELACDAYVIAQSPAARSLYAKALVDVCEFITQAKPATAPAVGMARGDRRSFERRLTMILKQRISARMPLFAWVTIFAAAVLVLPSFSTGQDEPKQPEINATKVVADSEPVTATGTTTEVVRDQPVTAEVVPGPEVRPAKVDPNLRSRTSTELPLGLREKTEEDLLNRVGPNRREVRSLRGKGKQLDQDSIDRITNVLMPLVEQMRSARPHDGDAYVVKAIFFHMLDRMPNPSESKMWQDYIQGTGDSGLKDLVAALGQSPEFLIPRYVYATKPTPIPGPSRAKQAKVQTLLRVTYEMPADKSKALAQFLKENVKPEIDVRVDEQAGLVVTAEADIQRPVAAIVSLMTGEPISLDLGDGSPVGPATVRVPVYEKFEPGAPSVYPTLPAATKATSRSSAAVPKEPNAPYRRSTTNQEPSTDYRTERTTPGNLPGTVTKELPDQNPPAAK